MRMDQVVAVPFGRHISHIRSFTAERYKYLPHTSFSKKEDCGLTKANQATGELWQTPAQLLPTQRTFSPSSRYAQLKAVNS